MEQGIPRPSNFINKFTVRSYPPQAEYLVDTRGNTIQATSRDCHGAARNKQFVRIFEDDVSPSRENTYHGYLMEPVVCIALNPLFEEAGLRVVMAPESLETSTEEQPGVDTLIVDDNNLIYGALQIKKKAAGGNHDRARYNPKIKAAKFNLSLGDFTLDLEGDYGIELPRWSKEYVARHIKGSGQIPGMDKFRKYVVQRLEKTVHDYRHRDLEPQLRLPYYLFPRDPEDMELVRWKSGVLHSILYELAMTM